MSYPPGTEPKTHNLRTHLDRLAPSGAIAETVTRVGTLATINPLVSGRQNLAAIVLPEKTITAITFCSSTQALVSGSNQWFALYDENRKLLRQTTDDTSTAWGANTAKTLNLTSSYTITREGLYYLGIMVVAATVPNLVGRSMSTVSASLTPLLCGWTDTGLTTTPPNPASAITAQTTLPYAYVS